MKTRAFSLLAPLLVLLVAGCGGEQFSVDDGSSASENDNTVEGRAAKGILQYALVEACALEQDSCRHLDQATTDENGDFSLDISGVSGPVLLRATPAGDGQSRMICDLADGCGEAVGFGDSVALPGSFRLTALITPRDLAQDEISITPATHMAAEWARSMPGGLTEQSITVARDRVAGLLGLDPGFVFRKVPDITDPDAADGADTDASRHGLLAAAFAEAAVDHGRGLQETLDGYTSTFTNNAGQLQQTGDYSLLELLSAAREIADKQGILTDIGDDIDIAITGLGEGPSQTPSSGTFDPQAFDRAMVPLNDLKHYLNEAGINESAGFLADQAYQVNWLYTEEMLGLVQATIQSGVAAVLAATMAGVYDGVADAPEFFDLSNLVNSTDGTIEALYYLDDQELRISGSGNGQTLNIVIDITPITADAGQLDYAVDGSISNDTAIGSLDGTLAVDLYETDLGPLVTELENQLNDGGTSEDLLQAFMDLLPEFHARGTVNGNGSLVSTDDMSFGFEGSLNAWGELDMPALESGGDVLSLQVTSGELISPAGDRIFSYEDGPALGLQVGQDAHLQAYFGTEAFGLPEMTFEADGSLEGLGELVLEIVQNLQDADPSTLTLSDITDLLAVLDYSVLDLHGTGGISIPDDGKSYRFRLEGTRLDASGPDGNDPAVDPALSFYLTALNGGYIYAGDTLVATVTFDWQKLGTDLHFVNGESRSYYLGPITDIVDPAILEALLGFLG